MGEASWRAGGACPADGCTFEFAIASDDEGELDIVGAAIMQAHSERSHDGVDVSLFGFRAGEDEEQEDPEERPRLLN